MKKIIMHSSNIKVMAVIIVALISLFLFIPAKNYEKDPYSKDFDLRVQDASASTSIEITGIVQKNESMYDILKKNNLDLNDFHELYRVSRKVFNLKKIMPGKSYVIIADPYKRVRELRYAMNDHSFLDIRRTQSGIDADIRNVEYDKKTGFITGIINDNLFSSLGTNNEYIRIAYELSDIFAWDIDFTTDLRKGDSFKIIVEELWLGNIFKGFGEIIAVEFNNNGRTYEAYRFNGGNGFGYYDLEGVSLRKTLLRAPLKFRYISSKYSKSRLHPILRRYRPHLGVDYVAPSGTPVSASGDGKVIFAGYKGQNGKLIMIKHNAGYTTYYGHLSRFAKHIRRGKSVKQGEVIGFVGRTGLATGSHLDYRIKNNGKFVNPLTVSLPGSSSIRNGKLNEYREFRVKSRIILDSIDIRDYAVVRNSSDAV